MFQWCSPRYLPPASRRQVVGCWCSPRANSPTLSFLPSQVHTQHWRYWVCGIGHLTQHAGCWPVNTYMRQWLQTQTSKHCLKTSQVCSHGLLTCQVHTATHQTVILILISLAQWRLVTNKGEMIFLPQDMYYGKSLLVSRPSGVWGQSLLRVDDTVKR